MSTESDGYEESETGSVISARRHVRTSGRSRARQSSGTASDVADRVNNIASSLRDTNQNLRDVGDLLGNYRSASSRQNDAIERLRANLNNRSDRQSDTMSASELRTGVGSRHRRSAFTSHMRRTRPSVRFSQNDEIHEIHQDIRDIGRGQSRLAEELTHERRQRRQQEMDDRRVLLDLSDSVKRSQREEIKPSERVEKRLKDLQDELRLQRETVSRRHQDNQHTHPREDIRTQIREGFLNVSREEDRELRSRLTQTEAERQKLASELESTRRKLDRTQGTSAALQQNVDSLRKDLARSDEDRHDLKSRLTRLQDSFHEDDVSFSKRERQQQAERAAEAEHERDMGRLKQEIQGLKTQLSRASSLQEYEGQRRELERSQKQKDQLSEHIDTLNRELTEKERKEGRLLSQLKDATDSLAESEHQRDLALTQLKGLEQRLRQKESESEMTLGRARESERLLTESQGKTEERQKKLVDMVKQLKLRCKKLERERESTQMTSSQHLDRTEDLSKENETLKTQKTNMMHRMENQQREISDVLERLARQDEQLRLRDIEVNELKSSCLKLDQELRENRILTDKLEGELRGEHSRYAALSDEKLKVCHQLDRAKAELHDAQGQNQTVQKELRDLTRQNAELTARLSELSNQKKEVEKQLAVAEEEKDNIKQDLNKLDIKFKEVQDFNAGLTEKLHHEMQTAKLNEEKLIHDLIRRQKRERAELDAELQALKIELAEARSSAKSLRRQADRGNSEMEKMREEIRHLDDENLKLKRNYDRIRAGFDEQTQLVEVGDNRASVLEKHLQRAEMTIQTLRLDHENAIRGLVREVDTLVGLVSQDSEDDHNIPQPLSRSQDALDAMLSDLKNKLYWLQKEVRKQADRRLRLRENLNRSRSEVDHLKRDQVADRFAYETQLDRTDDMLRDLQYQKQDLQLQNLERIHTVRALEKQVENMEDHIREGAQILERSFETLREQDPASPPPVRSAVVSEFDRLKELEKERQLIEEKYKRYQSTVSHLHQQLDESRKMNSSPLRRDNGLSGRRDNL